MINANELEQEVYNAFIHYLDTYFLQRNYKATKNLLSENIVGFGTALDEIALSSNNFAELFKRDIDQAPNPIHYDIVEVNIKLPTKDVGLVNCVLNIETIIIGQILKFNNLRSSFTFVKKTNSWLIEHIHMSFPSKEHEEDEAYPIKELEDRNTILQRLVEEKTNDLKEVLKQKDFLMKELSHRVKNNLNMISSIISLKNMELGDDADLTDVITKINTIEKVYKRLLISEDSKNLNIREYLIDILEDLFYSSTEKNILIEHEIEDIEIPIELAIPLGLIINELATNAVKHGFFEEPAVFKIKIQALNKNQYELIVSNTGKPFPDSFNLDRDGGIGLNLISALVKQIAGTIELRKTPFPVFRILFKI